MESKKLYIADLNVVFGEKEESLINRVDDIIMPALKSGIKKKVSDDTYYLFDEVEMEKNADDEWIIRGILVKDTIVDIKSEYSEQQGISNTNKKIKSAPYSLFIIYLKNHRMVLVKNQNSSPSVKSFGTALRSVLIRFIQEENKSRKQQDIESLPIPIVNIAGIKSSERILKTLEDVEKINELTFKFFPLNAEWDYEPVFGSIDEKIRKTIGAKRGRMIFPSPGSKEGVAEIIEATDGVVEASMKVTYSEKDNEGRKRTARIKDNEMTEVMDIDLYCDLKEAYTEVGRYAKSIKAINIQSRNHIVDYQKFLESRK